MVHSELTYFEDRVTSIAALMHAKTDRRYGIDNAIWDTLEYFANKPFLGIPISKGVGPLQMEDAEIYLQWREVSTRKARQLRAGRPVGAISLYGPLKEAA